MYAGPVLVGVGILAALGFGAWRLRQPLAPAYRVAALQPNVPPLQKAVPETFAAQIRLMERLAREAARRGARLIVFPESAIPQNLFGPDGLAEQIGSWTPGSVVVASSLEAGPHGVLRNIAAALHGREVLGTYAKWRLVPFGEAGITPGSRDGVIVTPAGTIGIFISYESAFADIGREAVQHPLGRARLPSPN
jgi:apolipoprotein N-acyltransferase